MEKFAPRFLSTAIGSLPHKSEEEACEVTLKFLDEIPAWPQLPNRSWLENMYVQYSEGMPCAQLDLDKQQLTFNSPKSCQKEIEHFYQKYLAQDVESFRISEEYAKGFYCLLKSLKNSGSWKGRFIKGHVTGPISIGLTITDKDKKPIFYDETLRDILVKTLAMKAKWQVKKFKQAFPEASVIIFLDEPYLASFGSGYISLNRETAIAALNEVIEATEAVSGIHCCGNTDWSLLTQTKVNIISFDAYSYSENLFLYMSDLEGFLEQGGSIAWGIVPSAQDILELDVINLTSKLEKEINLLIAKGINRQALLEKSIITPSCGTASLSVDQAEKVYQLANEVSNQIRAKYF